MTKNEQGALMNNIQKNSQERIKKLEKDMLILKGETAVKSFKQDSKVNEVQEKTNKLYKLYDAVDRLIAEIDENRKERAVLLRCIKITKIEYYLLSNSEAKSRLIY